MSSLNSRWFLFIPVTVTIQLTFETWWTKEKIFFIQQDFSDERKWKTNSEIPEPWAFSFFALRRIFFTCSSQDFVIPRTTERKLNLSGRGLVSPLSLIHWSHGPSSGNGRRDSQERPRTWTFLSLCCYHYLVLKTHLHSCKYEQACMLSETSADRWWQQNCTSGCRVLCILSQGEFKRQHQVIFS